MSAFDLNDGFIKTVTSGGAKVALRQSTITAVLDKWIRDEKTVGGCTVFTEDAPEGWQVKMPFDEVMKALTPDIYSPRKS